MSDKRWGKKYANIHIQHLIASLGGIQTGRMEECGKKDEKIDRGEVKETKPGRCKGIKKLRRNHATNREKNKGWKTRVHQK